MATLAIVFLELAHHAQGGIVHEDDLDAQTLLDHRAELLHGHLNTSVPGHKNYLGAGGAQAAPIEAGRPNPMQPRPPDETRVRGFLKW